MKFTKLAIACAFAIGMAAQPSLAQAGHEPGHEGEHEAPHHGGQVHDLHGECCADQNGNGMPDCCDAHEDGRHADCCEASSHEDHHG